MEFGVPREVRDMEMRVGLTPAGVLALTNAGHTVYVEKEAGMGAGFSDEAYRKANAQIVYSADEVYGRSEIVAKVTRPTAGEHKLFRQGQTIFSFFQLQSSSPDLLLALEAKDITAVSYEMITKADGVRPVLNPASEAAGRIAPLIAGRHLRSDQNGRGILLSGLPGVPPAAVVIIGAGTLGFEAAKAFFGLGAEVTVLDTDLRKLTAIDHWSNGHITTMYANELNISRVVQFADALIGAISTAGRRAPVIISEDHVKQMGHGSVIVDFSIDEGGCVATSRPTTLRNPSYVVHGVKHYCVPNVTSNYARTTSHAITIAATPYLLAAGRGDVENLTTNLPELLSGITLYKGKLANQITANALGRDLRIDIEKRNVS